MSKWTALLGAALFLSLQAGASADLTPLPYVDASVVPTLKETTQVKFTTDQGDFIVEVYPSAAPNAAKRFLQLVDSGYYDNTPIFRVVPRFVVQFGINGKGDHARWRDSNFKDDPSLFKLDRGTLAFAKAGPNTNSTQVFVNYGDNSQLASNGGFTTFARVIEGMSVVDKFRQVGDASMGLDQSALWANADQYIKTLAEKPNFIVKVARVAPPEAPSPSPTPPSPPSPPAPPAP